MCHLDDHAEKKDINQIAWRDSDVLNMKIRCVYVYLYCVLYLCVCIEAVRVTKFPGRQRR